MCCREMSESQGGNQGEGKLRNKKLVNQSDLGVPSQTREERGELSWVEKGKSNQLAAVRRKFGSLESGYI